jgi:ABC-type nickel/cobalt efflux system permease component RcnA
MPSSLFTLVLYVIAIDLGLTLVLYVIAISFVAVKSYIRRQARERKAKAYDSLVSLDALLRALRSEAATAARKDDVEFAALIVRFEAAHKEARAALNGCSYDAVTDIVEGVGRELAAFRQA